MVETYYFAAFSVSMVLLLMYAFSYHRHYDIHISMIFTLVPISNLSQFLLCKSVTLSEAVVALKFIYISGCYLILMVTLVVFTLCDIKLNRYVKLILYLITTVVMLFTQQIGENDLYYKNIGFARENGISVITKDYGVLHKFFYLMVLTYFILSMGAMVFGIFHKNQVSNRFIALLSLPELLAFISFFLSRKMYSYIDFFPDVEFVPFAYDVALIVYLIINHKLVLYNIQDTVITSVVLKGETGLISFDFSYRYLGSNDAAKKVFPELNELIVDKPADSTRSGAKIMKWLEEFRMDNSIDTFYYRCGDKTYLVNISYLSDGRHKRGYQVYITDDTQNQRYIALLDSFNTELKEEVAEKTSHIVEMNDNLILSMAMMVESRDNSTGGHIRRTSDCVQILLTEIIEQGEMELSESFCRNLIKSAPMHDLGKIAVDDAILRKPGRFTDEEYAVMKTHAAEGARIVHEILKNTDDEELKVIAENVAHYHHERWDGSGYPEGLKGEEIPLEARIMAIADVYDALVSKRVYKERMSFEQADKIIMEGIGKHFDKALEKYYVSARPKLEEYYTDSE
ncbi:MAG: HD domain-containing protein [Ruminococcus sp.]|nr:HD domain-containing protein [Ruminococcus sp.]